MIRHTVVFTLQHASGFAEKKPFLQAFNFLAAIPGFEMFDKMRQTSRKNDYSFGFSLEFADPAAYCA